METGWKRNNWYLTVRDAESAITFDACKVNMINMMFAMTTAYTVLADARTVFQFMKQMLLCHKA